jgi:hypothetical protein
MPQGKPTIVSAASPERSIARRETLSSEYLCEIGNSAFDLRVRALTGRQTALPRWLSVRCREVR